MQVTIAVIYCLFAAGIVFGFAALKPVLISEGVYHELCTQKEVDDHVHVCHEQELRLNFMFTCAAVSTNVAALPVGTILDRYGPRISSLIGCVLLTVGTLFMAFASSMKFDGYVAGYLCLALGGPFVFIASFQLSNTFPRRSGLILALLTSAFDASSAVFLLYRLIYSASGKTFTPKKFFLCYLVVPAFIALSQLLIMPATSYKTVGELVATVEQNKTHDHDDEHSNHTHSDAQADTPLLRRESVASEITALLGSKDASEQAAKEQEIQASSGVWGALHHKTAWQQMKTPWFILITLFTVVQMTRINYFVATVRAQYEYLMHSFDLARRINSFFDVALPAGGVVSAPFIGYVLDNTSTPFTLSLLVGFATLIGVVGTIPGQANLWVAYIHVCLFVIYRPFYYTAVSDYAAKVFGFATFGKVYGLIICTAGLGNFSQYGLDAATVRLFKANPIPVNLGLLGLGFVVGSTLVGYVYWRSRHIRRELLELEAESSVGGERERLMPGGSGGR